MYHIMMDDQNITRRLLKVPDLASKSGTFSV